LELGIGSRSEGNFCTKLKNGTPVFNLHRINDYVLDYRRELLSSSPQVWNFCGRPGCPPKKTVTGSGSGPAYDKLTIRNLAGFSRSLFAQYFAEQKKSGGGEGATTYIRKAIT
jgi:hypothetical protein